MNLGEIKKAIDGLIALPLAQGAKRNIVFWYDDEGSYKESIDEVELNDAKIIKLYDNNAFAMKYYIEVEDTTSNLLVYSPLPRPAYRDNWLTDILKYSKEFATDETSINLLTYKMDISMRGAMKLYNKFFNDKTRTKKFESYQINNFTDQKLHLAILSALCKLPTPNFENAIKTLLIEMVNEEDVIYKSIQSFGSEEVLWTLIKNVYGYEFEDKSLQKLAIVLFTTHLAWIYDGNIPKPWEDYIALTKKTEVKDEKDLAKHERGLNANCYVFIDNFMNYSPLSQEYDKLSGFVAEKLKLNEVMAKWKPEDYLDCDSFICFDQFIMKRITENLLLEVGEFEKYRKMINHRIKKHYAQVLTDEYNVINYACLILELEKTMNQFIGSTPLQLFENYCKDYYKFDYYYRAFIVAFDKLSDEEGYTKLYMKIENMYTYWYLNELSVKWSSVIDNDLTDNWNLYDIPSQRDFYKDNISKFVTDNQRIIVIISDALRYETAVELTDKLNSSLKGGATLSPMLSSIPSITSIGMAALLPNTQIDILDKENILVDGISSKGTDNRDSILKTIDQKAMAVRYKDFPTVGKDIKERIKEQKLIYIYHNVIDARGDHVPSENEVFDATTKAIDDLSSLVERLRSSGVINIIITADHGYIYRRTSLNESDKTPKNFDSNKNSGRRYYFTDDDDCVEGTHKISLQYLLGNESNMNAFIPRSANCFKIQGSGTNYVHGGASLQEVVLPVIKFRSDKNLKEDLEAKPVKLSLTSISRKITSIISYLEFFQNEKVEEKKIAIRVKAYFVDEKDNRISNENIIIADSHSSKPEDRTFKEKFTLKNISYDKANTYYLVLENDDEMVQTVLEKIPFTIDLIFDNPFEI